MGSEVSTVGGAVATAATSVAAGVCFGQVETLNNAVVHSAKYTASNFMESNVRHVGEFTGMSIAAAATLGQCEAVNDHWCTTANATGSKLVGTLNDVADGIPVVGHAKGAIHYACGDHSGGEKAMKAASRTIGVVGGAVAGVPLGPAGMMAGGIAGGAAMDGIITGVDSAVHQEYRPMGQVAAWTELVTAKNPENVLNGLVGVVATPVMDGVAGYGVGKTVSAIKQGRLVKQVGTFLEEGGNMDLMEALDAANKVKPTGRYVVDNPHHRQAPGKQPVYSGRDIPAEGWYKDGQEVYRGDHRLAQGDRLNQVFNEGIPPKGHLDNDAFHHTRGNAEGTNFVSTSKKIKIAKGFGEAKKRGPTTSTVLKIRSRGGIDINATASSLGAENWYPGQAEVAIYRGVRSSDIVGTLKFPAEGGRVVFHKNPNFVPTADTHYIIRSTPSRQGLFPVVYARNDNHDEL